MSFKSYINYITESIVDQYKAVRALARPGDELLRKTHGTAWPQSMALHSYHDGRQPPTISPQIDRGYGTNMDGVYFNDDQTALTGVNTLRNPSWEEKVGTNTHELAHAAQHAAQFRDNAIPSKDASLTRSQPQIARFKDDQKRGTRSHKRKVKRNAEIMASPQSHYSKGMSALAQNMHQYINTDIEVGARVIGHAGQHLDIRADPDKPDTSAHMRELANELAFRHHTTHFFTKDAARQRPSTDQRSTDIHAQAQVVQSAIEDLRRSSLAKFRRSEEDFGPTLQPRSLKKGMKQYSRLIQHHEEELPADIHTPEGRDAFIRTHGSRGDIEMMDDMNKRYAPK